MAAQVHSRQVEAVEVPNVAVAEPHVHAYRQRIGVVRSGSSARPGGLHQLLQRADVVPVLVGGGDQRQLGRG
ncbi:hypothetical protein QF038_000198 [Pseudarthrobacter sp. W1I19]|nr:hypothetical protein [Pseudarthrobacter sp. W1I19]